MKRREARAIRLQEDAMGAILAISLVAAVCLMCRQVP
jgi:hypothetical protein